MDDEEEEHDDKQVMRVPEKLKLVVFDVFKRGRVNKKAQKDEEKARDQGPRAHDVQGGGGEQAIIKEVKHGVAHGAHENVKRDDTVKREGKINGNE